ncbi:uncharacterized protein [Typha angustifolia]|uniref:uncharacterized protein n=1 Tax=Typha angustifolia TaxID=59011 RepID=UPI003C307F15
MAFIDVVVPVVMDEDTCCKMGPFCLQIRRWSRRKLAEEAEHKVQGEAKKEKLLAAEKGHTTPANFLVAKEKFLIRFATKGVVRLFNVVSKGQNPQRGLNPSKLKDAKGIDCISYSLYLTLPSLDKEDTYEPGWAPLRESYMLTNSNSKVEVWDKLPDPTATVDEDEVPIGSSSD